MARLQISLLYLLFLLFLCKFTPSFASELTFELPDNANQCFYEEIKMGVDCTLEFQVITGGQYDVDVVLEDPNGKSLYKEARKQLDSHAYKTEVAGTYKVCFSNEFSTFSHKVVYLDWQVGADEHNALPIPRVGAGTSQMERSVETINDRLKIVDDYQTHHRLREATSRKRAEELNERVTYWSLGQTAVVLLIGVGQVFLLRSFFADRKPPGGY
uniref:GOLD domain-containing protein n=1 Tax=Globodera pallida TaxID=36090 RepID=A0A183BVG3_GLOPA